MEADREPICMVVMVIMAAALTHTVVLVEVVVVVLQAQKVQAMLALAVQMVHKGAGHCLEWVAEELPANLENPMENYTLAAVAVATILTVPYITAGLAAAVTVGALIAEGTLLLLARAVPIQAAAVAVAEMVWLPLPVVAVS